jgi:hypothetical protein
MPRPWSNEGEEATTTETVYKLVLTQPIDAPCEALFR